MHHVPHLRSQLGLGLLQVPGYCCILSFKTLESKFRISQLLISNPFQINFWMWCDSSSATHVFLFFHLFLLLLQTFILVFLALFFKFSPSGKEKLVIRRDLQNNIQVPTEHFWRWATFTVWIPERRNSRSRSIIVIGYMNHIWVWLLLLHLIGRCEYRCVTHSCFDLRWSSLAFSRSAFSFSSFSFLSRFSRSSFSFFSLLSFSRSSLSFRASSFFFSLADLASSFCRSFSCLSWSRSSCSCKLWSHIRHQSLHKGSGGATEGQ